MENVKETYALDFIPSSQAINIIKSSIKDDFICVEEKPYQKHIFFKNIGKILIHYSDKGELTLNLRECKNIEEIKNCLNKPLNLEDNNNGKTKLPKTWRLNSIKLANQLAQELMKKFEKKIIFSGAGINQNFVLKIKGKNSLVYDKNSELYLGPYNNQVTDEIVKYIESFLKSNIAKNKIIIKEVLTKKERYGEFIRKNSGNELCKYITENLYNFLSGRDIQEIEDGFKMLDLVIKNNIQFNNYKVLIRPFSIAFEGCIIKFCLDNGDINKEEYEINSMVAQVGDLIYKKLPKYALIIERKYKGIFDNIKAIWKSKRNNYMHSDMYSYSEIETLEEAKAKIIEILLVMDNLVDGLSLINDQK